MVKRGTQCRVEIGRVQHQQGTLDSAVQCRVEMGREEQGAQHSVGWKGGGVKSWPFIICPAGLWGKNPPQAVC